MGERTLCLCCAVVFPLHAEITLRVGAIPMKTVGFFAAQHGAGVGRLLGVAALMGGGAGCCDFFPLCGAKNVSRICAIRTPSAFFAGRAA